MFLLAKFFARSYFCFCSKAVCSRWLPLKAQQETTGITCRFAQSNMVEILKRGQQYSKQHRRTYSMNMRWSKIFANLCNFVARVTFLQRSVNLHDTMDQSEIRQLYACWRFRIINESYNINWPWLNWISNKFLLLQVVVSSVSDVRSWRNE